jgi:hypothetical protein
LRIHQEKKGKKCKRIRQLNAHAKGEKQVRLVEIEKIISIHNTCGDR